MIDHRTLIAAVAAMTLAAACPGQIVRVHAPPRPASRAPAPPDDLLAGPTVAPAATQPMRMPFGGDDRGPRDRVPPRRWQALYAELDLTDAQRETMRTRLRAFLGADRAFRRDHGAELRGLFRRRPGGPEGPPLDDAERARLQALLAERPDVEAVQSALWAQLEPDQQDALRAALAAEQARRRAARRERAMQSEAPAPKRPD